MIAPGTSEGLRADPVTDVLQRTSRADAPEMQGFRSSVTIAIGNSSESLRLHASSVKAISSESVSVEFVRSQRSCVGDFWPFACYERECGQAREAWPDEHERAVGMEHMAAFGSRGAS